jgi:class III poly(R)-hydroxyalkanoic acid synthase PhaE subunit
MAYGERIQRQLLQGSEAWQAASPFSTLPSFGPAGDFARRLTQAFDGWVEWNRANAAYQTLLAELWRRAFERFLVELVEKGQAATTPDSVRALTEAFLETAEALFVEEFETDRYVEAQGRVLKAWSEYSARTQDVVDGVLKFGQVPSRSEVDSTAKTVHDLRREVRELRRELRELRREAGEPAAREAEV